jgi:uncharacterized membrane protein
MPHLTIAGALARWSSLYANLAALRSAVTFAHIGGLLGGGGAAIAADRGMLIALRQDASARRAQLVALAGTHRVVMIGLAVVIISGLLIFAADVDTFLYSWVFWIKMGLIAALLGNGLVLQSAEQRALIGGDEASGCLRATAIASLALWFLTTLAGAVLPNVG